LRRRDAAALAVLIPLLVALLIHYFFPGSFDLLLGYMLAASLLFKSAILSFATASKLKLIAFFKGLTLLQGTLLMVKRWFLDNIFSQWLKRNVLDHISHAMKEALEYYRGLDLGRKAKNITIAVIFSLISFWLVYMSGYMSHIFLFAEIKMIVISISKTLLLITGKLLSLLFNSWLTPILEIFAFSYLFSWLERKLGPTHPVNRFISYMGGLMGRLFRIVSYLVKRYIDPLLNRRISRYSKKIATALKRYIEEKKIAYEYEQFDRFERAIMKAHIDAYFSFEGMHEIRDKRRLYSLINRKSSDGIDIVAFVSRDERGELLPVDADDTFYNDTFILEGMASDSIGGVKREIEGHPDYSDFWILNTSTYPATLRSRSEIFPAKFIEGQSLTRIESPKPIEYGARELYLEFHDKAEYFTPVERG